ncbi:sigma-70 family RNA polymerase sigma factor [Metasolibacillus meyeri]|uniref:sigma-70 family RNA polymerase sigma factor n=1 Tax=Metasolibacillus meyeri TaxID=1071052 RepID=UPI000D2F4A33|nr:sigma-70 family RNA polymerase sigma factor [Metasolibacillus meyeri]
MEDVVTLQDEQTAEDVVEALMHMYGQSILQLVYAYVHNEAVAEDLTQEIFLKCYKALPTYKAKSSLKTWLWRIAINHAKDYLKSWHNQNIYTADDTVLHNVHSNEEIEQQIIQQDEDAALADAVMQLPVIYREVIYLFYFEEYTMKQIAALLQVNENTVKTRLRKGKALLRTRLEAL